MQKISSQSLIKARHRDRIDLLTQQVEPNSDDDKKFYLIFTHFPGPNVLKNIVEKNWPILAKNKSTRTIFESKVIFGYPRCKNLRDSLVSAKVKQTNPSHTSRTTAFNSCSIKNCRYCPHLGQSQATPLLDATHLENWSAASPTISSIAFLTRDASTIRNHIEINWIHRLNTIEPKGLDLLD
jgi:hypothetical protein